MVDRRVEAQQLVDEFLARCRTPVPIAPTGNVPAPLRVLWCRLVLEEALEACAAAGVKIQHCCEDLRVENLVMEAAGPANVVEVADGVGDTLYTALALGSVFGISAWPVLLEICHNNLAKFGPGHTVREDGKLVKPPGHPRPAVRSILENQGWQPPD